jgi:hypothetical protein
MMIRNIKAVERTAFPQQAKNEVYNIVWAKTFKGVQKWQWKI